MIVNIIEQTYDVDRLWKECNEIINHFTTETEQICLSHREEITDQKQKMSDGIGSLMNKNLNERDFCIFNEEFSGTYLEEVYRSIPYNIGRLRIMKIKAHKCYSIHKDYTSRIHLPLITNEHCYMVFPDDNFVYHMVADGHMYLTNTKIRHTAFNGGKQDRFHLVGALY